MTENARATQSAMERALRWMATRKHALPLDLINHALNDPRSDSADYLAPLVAPTESMPGGTTESRALAAWGLVIHGIDRVGSADDARQQNALFAAFRLRRLPEITTWRSTLEGRFRQLMVLTDVFGDPPPSTTTPMHQAWRRGVREKLAPMLQEQADALTADGSGWAALAEAARTAEPMAGRRLMATEATNGDHHPSPGAQPVFLELFVTNVIMKGRAVHRRITERLVTARADGVDGYLATSIAGWHRHADDIPIRPLWGCLVEDPAGRYRDSAITRLIFPRTLSRDEHHYFASEAVDENLGQDRLWVNVEVDHHGIAPGRLLYGCVPVSGLTIRIRFDGTEVPEACWWYAEQTERERRIRPPDGDPHLLPIVADTVEHTFTERCYPRGNYGISLLWRSTRSVGLSL